MPNWTRNRIAMLGEDMKKALNEEGMFDFDMIRPMPDDLHITSGGIKREAIKAAKARRRGDYVALDAIAEEALPWKGFGEQERDMDWKTAEDLANYGERYLSNMARYGAYDWYDWRWENWHTKWNACGCRVNECGKFAVATFNTAWSEPSAEMLAELAQKCSLPIWHEWGYEDFDGIHSLRFEVDGTWDVAEDQFLLIAQSWGEEEPDLFYAEEREFSEKEVASRLE